jgi:hypothetical protein
MLALAALPSAFNGAAAFNGAVCTPKRGHVCMESLSDLKEVALKLNPAVGYWDPLKLGEVSLACR